MSIQVVYAIVKAGGRQEKVSVGDVVVVDRLAGEVGDEIDLVPLMLVDGDTVTTTAADLAKASVTAEILGEKKGPKINILKFKNKTGFRKRQGYRAKLTEIRKFRNSALYPTPPGSCTSPHHFQSDGTGYDNPD